MKNKPLVIAHRGYSGKYPENTMAAFEAAIRFGADMIECDLHLCSDNKIVITHDYKLGRCIPGSEYVYKLSSEKVRHESAGAWYGSQFKSQKAPLLSELLDLCKGKIALNLEVKSEPQRTKLSRAKLIASLLKDLKNFKMQKEVVISSFEPSFLADLSKTTRALKLGVLDESPDRKLRLDFAKQISAYSYHPHLKKISFDDCSTMQKRGLRVYPWTANTQSEIKMLLAMGVDGIISNELNLLKKEVEKF